MNTPQKKSPLSIILKILGIALDVILVLIIVFSLYTAIARGITGKPYAKVFGFTAAVVQTGSMAGDREDSIEGNSLVFTIEQSEYHIDDIIMFEDGNNTVTHRIIAITENGFTTQGDANSGSEDIIPHQIVGKVFLTIPYVGYVIRYIQANPIVLMVVVLVCALIIILPSLFKKEKSDS